MSDIPELTFVEESQLFLFSLDSRSQTQCSWKHRSGICIRQQGGEHKSRSQECSLRNRLPDDLFYQAGRIIKENRFLFDFLHRSLLEEWTVQFRAFRDRRTISIPGSPDLDNSLNHFGVLIRFRDRKSRSFQEIGEGNTKEFSFNLSGLSRRLEAVLRNQREQKRLGTSQLFPVILHAGEGAIFFHEILGHALEADHVSKRLSPFQPSDLGKPVCPISLSLLPFDASDPFFSSFRTDDEGEKRLSSPLIERGVLQNFLTDRFHRLALNIPGGGHGRVEDFSCPPQPRMFGLYLQPGEFEFDEVMASVDRGIFAREFDRGAVDFVSGRFSFSAIETYWIKNGRLDAPLGRLVFQGEIQDILSEIEMIASDFRYDKGISFCQKNGQALPVRIGQPSVKIRRLEVHQETDD